MEVVRAHSVLVVEDEMIVATDLQQTLADMGYDAFAIASSAEEALCRASERCPDVVLMDIRIKGRRDGIETAELLRERFHVPVVYITAHADDATLDRAKKTEPYGYLMKPVKMAELRSVIEVAIYKHAMEKRLRERERWFSTTLHSITDAVITVDLAGGVTFMNPAAETLTGLSSRDAIGRPASEVARLVDPGVPASPLDTVLETRQPIAIAEASLRHETSANKLISETAAPVLDDGEMLGAVMVFRDITEQKLLQKQLELADRLASLGTMAAGVAHEINNPLAVVTTNASFALEELRKLWTDGDETSSRLQEVVRALSDLESGAHRIARIVHDLQAFSRPSQPAAGEANVAAAIDWAIRSTAHEFRSRCEVLANVGDVSSVAIDETRLGQILVNLLMNAAHAIPPGNFARNSVTISAYKDGSSVVISVRDTGTGIPPEVLKRIFEPFFTTKPVGVGTGLGLAICHGMATAAGGRLDVESVVGNGTTFRIILPAAAPPQSKNSEPAVVQTRRGRILTVDDEPMILVAVKRLLREHDVVAVDDAREAVAMLDRGEHFDIIFSDMMMPHMTGMEFYETLLARHPEATRRIVFLSGGAVNARVADFLAVVPNISLEKPINAKIFRALVQQLLSVDN